MRRCLIIIFFGVLLFANPAQAHEDHTEGYHNPIDADYFNVVNEIKGGTLDVNIEDNTQQINVANSGKGTLVVLGYDDKTPWLRIDKNRIFLNQNSADYYINEGQTQPDVLSATVKWTQVDKGNSWTWQDRRLRWQSDEMPAWLKENSDDIQQVLSWQINFRYDDAKGQIKGSLYWRGEGNGEVDETKITKPENETIARIKELPTWVLFAFPAILVMLIIYTARLFKPKTKMEPIDDDEGGPQGNEIV